MTDPQLSVDSISDVLAVSTSDRTSSVLSPRAQNFDLRNGMHPRFGLYHQEVIYGDPDNDKYIFEEGNIQGFWKYQSNSFRPSGLIYLIAGVVFFGAIAGHRLFVRRLIDGLNPTVIHSWSCQAFNWFLIQNGVDNCVIWDGFSDVAFQADPSKSEMPVGGPMEFIHHRVVVASTDGQDKIAVSDLWRADKTNAIYMFTESPVWANAGVFGLHANYGRLVGFAVIPRDKRTANGQGELLIIGSNGAQTLNIQQPRGNWIDSQIQDTANMGFGAASLYGFTVHDAKLFYVAADGIRQWSPTGIDGLTGQRDVLISNDVEAYWMRSDANQRNLLQVGVHDSRLFFGVYPELVKSKEWGKHRVTNAWLTLDTMRRSRNGETIPLSWYGINCGIRPVQYVSNLRVRDVHRSYVASHDVDGKNRTFEITNYLRDDIIEGRARKIRWHIDTPLIGTDARGGKHLVPKKPSNLRLDYTEADGDVEVTARYRSEDSFCLKEWGDMKACQPVNTEICVSRPLHRGRRNFESPKEDVCGMTSSQYRVRLEGKGHLRVVNLIGGLLPVPNAQIFSREEMACGSCDSTGASSDSQCCETTELYQIIQEPATC